MAESTREIRRRIRSIKNIGQITKAMELVSAAKMRRAQAQALASRTYARLTSELLRNLMAKVEDFEHPLLKKVKGDDFSKLIILITSDRGLAGALNTNVINAALRKSEEFGKERVDFLTVGKKSADAVKRFKMNIVAAFPSRDKNVTILDARAISEIAVKDYLSGRYDGVYIVYSEFISTLSQRPNVLQLLPLIPSAEADREEYIFEPNISKILDKLLYRGIEFALYQTLVESVASEHSARMVAMRNANEASRDLVSELELTYNQARQSGITRELAEISAAKLAME